MSTDEAGAVAGTVPEPTQQEQAAAQPEAARELVPADERARREHRMEALSVVGRVYTLEQVDVLKNTVAREATNVELALFLTVCQRTQLDPFTGQIHFVKRYDHTLGKKVGAFQIGIGGFRVISQRTGKDRGRLGPFWCGPDGEWVDVWLKTEPPFAAKVGILHADFTQPVWSIARWSASVQTKSDNSVTRMWSVRDAEQLAKCAEADARRVAFPNDLTGIYSDDEAQIMDAMVEEPPAIARPAARAIEQQSTLRLEAEAAVREIVGGARQDVGEAGKEAPPTAEPEPTFGGAPAEIPFADRLEVFLQFEQPDVVTALSAMRLATKGERMFYEDPEISPDVKRVVVVDAELLTSFRAKPVNTWLDQIHAKSDAWRLFCTKTLKVADSLGVEVVR